MEDQRLAWYRRPGVWLALLLLGACLLRLWHLERWLPEVYEEATPVLRARDFWGWQTGRFDFNPHFFNYPALSFYLHFAFQGAVLGLGLVGGWIDSVDQFRQLLLVDYHSFVLLGRAVTVLFDLGAVAAVYGLGRRLGGQQTGLLAALLLACNSLHIGLSQQVIVDVPLTFFAVLTLLFAVDIAGEGRRAAYVCSGLFVGLAAATKYTGALLAAPVAVAALPHLLERAQRGMALRRLALGGVAAGAVFLLCNPFIPTSFGAFLSHFSLEREHMALGHFGDNAPGSTVWFYAAALWGAVGVAGLAAVAALAQAVRGRDWRSGVIGVWIVFYLVVVSTWNMRAERYLLPIVPVLAVAAGLGFGWAVARLPWPAWRRLAWVVAIGLYALPQVLALEAHYARVSAPETRLQAKEWLEAEVPAGALMAIEHYTYYPDRDSPHYWLVRIPLHTVHPEKVSGCYQYGWYENFDYIALSSYVWGRYGAEPGLFPVQAAFYRRLERDWQLVRRFAPGAGTGPEIALYRNPAGQRPDERFDMALYRSLDLASVTEVQKFLNVLGYALKGAGFERRAWDVAQKIGMLQRRKTR